MPLCKKCGECCKKSPYIFESEIKRIFDFVKNNEELSRKIKTSDDFLVFVEHDFDLTEGDKSDWMVKKNGYNCVFYKEKKCLIYMRLDHTSAKNIFVIKQGKYKIILLIILKDFSLGVFC